MVVSSLRNRNVTIGGRRTSMKLEPGMWDALDEICHRESTAIHEICTRIAKDHKGYNLTAATRAFILAYYRAAATEDGHLAAGHGVRPDRRTKSLAEQKLSARITVRPQVNSSPITRRLTGS
ncbi:ribbon-helix-helix domain-containing protein [Telmatospirillum sp.]|uniref:ribbon-helix-helix domain-containing protein n=1 Tax=Telmatospirillum sp. TaxID=2079197 RepID=UPI00283DEA25|nr:ribbon-helix-helix domain-containing protein [Telmatospirillum sp.]MDR3437011.1 ribbon-helix-helix domain-containing protein [Telmatospirillum sp.]